MLAVGLTIGLVECSGGKKAEPAATRAASTQIESAQEAAKAPGATKEAPGAEGEERESKAQIAGNSRWAAPVKVPEGFPSKNTTLVSPYETGGTSDISTRIHADYISGIMDGAMMNVTDVTGSGGVVSIQRVIPSSGDGYTLLIAPASYAMQYAKGSCEFTYEDFGPVNLFVISYLGMAVNISSGIKTYEDLAQAVKGRPGRLKFGVITSGLPVFCVLAVGKQESADFNTIDIGGTTLNAPELLSNRIDVMIDSLVGLISRMDSGDFITLGSYADDRFANYPDVPTFTGLGYETSVMDQVFGIWAPKDTPNDVVEYFSSLLGTVAMDEGVQKQLADLTYSTSYTPTAEYVAYLERMYTGFQEFAKGLN